MNMETITFEIIRKIQREERDSPLLTKLPEKFFEGVALYLEQKKKIGKDELEVKNIKRLVENIFERRERKILNQALITVRTKIPPQNLTEEEKDFFNELVRMLEERRKKFYSIFEEGEIPSLEQEAKILMKKVIFKEDVEDFVGIDGNVYGPFKKGDEAEIPLENFEILYKKGVVEEVKI